VEWKRKDLLGLEYLKPQEIKLILETAEACKGIFSRDIKKLPTLRGKTLVNIFYEPSTRTRTSFEIAGKWMSADVVNVTVSASSVQKGESLQDTLKTIQAVGADVVAIRHSSAGVPHMLSKLLKISVINAGDGAHEHPTQGLLDLLTIKERKGSFDGLKVAILGDISHSRVAKSNIWGLSKLGAEVTVVGPATLMPPGIEDLGVKVSYDLDEVIGQVDVINVLRLQLERQKKGLFPTIREYSKLYGLNSRRLAKAKDDLVILHPGPTNLGIEITQDVCDDPRAAITEQVTNGVAVRMAILYLLLGGATKNELID
jgi:aspartate carbamoyltransferase catalytic subunit